MAVINFIKPIIEAPKIDTKIYALSTPLVTEQTLQELAKTFDLTGQGDISTLSETRRLSYMRGVTVIRQYRVSAGFKYYNKKRWQRDDGKSDVGFNENEAVSIAQKFIQQTNLLSKNEYTLANVTKLSCGTTQRGSNQTKIRTIDYGVVFTRVVDNIPVEGSGGKAVVFIDWNGEITGCQRIWRPLGQVHQTIPFNILQSPDFAKRDLEAHWSSVEGVITAEEMRFGYFEHGMFDPQQFLQPVYVIPFTVTSADGQFKMKSVHVVPAAPQPPEVIFPPPGPKKAQPVRQR